MQQKRGPITTADVYRAIHEYHKNKGAGRKVSQFLRELSPSTFADTSPDDIQKLEKQAKYYWDAPSAKEAKDLGTFQGKRLDEYELFQLTELLLEEKTKAGTLSNRVITTLKERFSESGIPIPSMQIWKNNNKYTRTVMHEFYKLGDVKRADKIVTMHVRNPDVPLDNYVPELCKDPDMAEEIRLLTDLKLVTNENFQVLSNNRNHLKPVINWINELKVKKPYADRPEVLNFALKYPAEKENLLRLIDYYHDSHKGDENSWNESVVLLVKMSEFTPKNIPALLQLIMLLKDAHDLQQPKDNEQAKNLLTQIHLALHVENVDRLQEICDFVAFLKSRNLSKVDTSLIFKLMKQGKYIADVKKILISTKKLDQISDIQYVHYLLDHAVSLPSLIPVIFRMSVEHVTSENIKLLLENANLMPAVLNIFLESVSYGLIQQDRNTEFLHLVIQSTDFWSRLRKVSRSDWTVGFIFKHRFKLFNNWDFFNVVCFLFNGGYVTEREKILSLIMNTLNPVVTLRDLAAAIDVDKGEYRYRFSSVMGIGSADPFNHLSTDEYYSRANKYFRENQSLFEALIQESNLRQETERTMPLLAAMKVDPKIGHSVIPLLRNKGRVKFTIYDYLYGTGIDEKPKTKAEEKAEASPALNDNKIPAADEKQGKGYVYAGKVEPLSFLTTTKPETIEPPQFVRDYLARDAATQQAHLALIASDEKGLNQNVFMDGAVAFLRECPFQSKLTFYQFFVGPDTDKGRWNLAEVLREHFKEKECRHARYMFFSIPTNNRRHSVAVLIDLKNRVVYGVDSQPSDDTDAVRVKLQNAVKEVTELNGFTLEILPTHIKQQKDNEYCGLYTALNIIGLILNIENVKMNFPVGQTNLFVPLKKNGEGLVTRTKEQIHLLLGVIQMANDKYHATPIKKTTSGLG